MNLKRATQQIANCLSELKVKFDIKSYSDISEISFETDKIIFGLSMDKKEISYMIYLKNYLYEGIEKEKFSDGKAIKQLTNKLQLALS